MMEQVKRSLSKTDRIFREESISRCIHTELRTCDLDDGPFAFEVTKPQNPELQFQWLANMLCSLSVAVQLSIVRLCRRS